MGCSSKTGLDQPTVPPPTAIERSQGSQDTTENAFFFSSLLAQLLALSSLILRYAADKILSFCFSYKPKCLESLMIDHLHNTGASYSNI